MELNGWLFEGLFRLLGKIVNEGEDAWASIQWVEWIDEYSFGCVTLFFGHNKEWDEHVEYIREWEGCSDNSRVHKVYGGEYWWEDKCSGRVAREDGIIHIQAGHNVGNRRGIEESRWWATSRWSSLT